MIRYTMLIAFLTIFVTACSQESETIEETPAAIEAAQEKMAEEIKATAEEMTEEASTETADTEEIVTDK